MQLGFLCREGASGGFDRGQVIEVHFKKSEGSRQFDLDGFDFGQRFLGMLLL